MCEIKNDHDALAAVCEMFFINSSGGLEWSLKEGVSIGDKNAKLEIYLKERFEEVKNARLYDSKRS